MKIRKVFLPILTLVLLASCGGKSSNSTVSDPGSSLEPSSASSSEPLPEFEAFTLSQLHDARVANSLASLYNKYVSVKGKVVFVKRSAEDDGELIIQNGKYAVEVNYPQTFTVNLGDVVEVKGVLDGIKVGDIGTIWVNTYRDSVANSDIKVINEAIATETVTITKEADLVEYDCSYSSIDFVVVGSRTNAAFVGKLSEGDQEFIVANKLRVAEKFDEPPFNVGETWKYEGVFSYSGDETAKVIRYFDKDGFTPANSK